jgi:protein EFR3
MRCLVACLAGLIRVATHPTELNDATKSRSLLNGTTSADQTRRPPTRGGTAGSMTGRRNPISPVVWQETLALLCDANFGTRAEYVRALALFIKSEIPKEVDPENGGLRSGRKSVDYSNSDETTRFLHALHASTFTLAVSPSLGLSSAPSSDAPSHASTQILTENDTDVENETRNTDINIIGPSSVGTLTASAQLGPPPMFERKPPEGKRGSSRSRTGSLALSLLEPVPTHLIAPAPSPATPSDYSHLVTILTSPYEKSPVRALLTGVPMLLALDMASCVPVSGADEATVARRHALREVVVRVWSVIGRVFDSPEIRQLSENVSDAYVSGRC